MYRTFCQTSSGFPQCLQVMFPLDVVEVVMLVSTSFFVWWDIPQQEV